jgi:nitrite reductase/ring-hydroxylating ferredoxin subunit
LFILIAQPIANSFREVLGMGFVKVASAKDVAHGKMIGAGAGGKQILIANVNGSFYAMEDKCTHRGCRLSGGKLEEGNVYCPCHGSVFNVKTGNVVKGPAKTPQPTFQLKVEKDQVMVNI